MNKDLIIQENDLELIVSEKTLGHLTTNALQIKEMVERALPIYSISNYDSSNIDKAKKDKAVLNKASKALNSKRIEIEKEFVKPFEEFKTIISDTIKLINECSSKIDNIIKEEDLKYKNEKRKRLIEYYNREYKPVSFSKIEKKEWLNKSENENKIFEEIDSIVSSISRDIETLSKMQDSDALIVYYKECLDLNKTIQYETQLSENRESREDKKQVYEQDNNFDETYVRTFKVECSLEQLIGLENYMNENHIKFEKL